MNNRNFIFLILSISILSKGFDAKPNYYSNEKGKKTLAEKKNKKT